MKDLKILGTAENKYYGTFNDITYENGDFVMLSGASKLKQNMAKILLTREGENKVFPGYGSNLQSLINQKIDNTSVRKNIVNGIIYAFTYLNEIDDTTDLDEKIDQIKSIDVNIDPVDPRKVFIRIEVINKVGETLIITLGG